MLLSAARERDLVRPDLNPGMAPVQSCPACCFSDSFLRRESHILLAKDSHFAMSTEHLQPPGLPAEIFLVINTFSKRAREHPLKLM